MLEISEETARKKTESLTDFPYFKRDIVFYNRHRVPIFGWDRNNKVKSNQEEKVKKIACFIICERHKETTISIVFKKRKLLEINGVFLRKT